MKYISSIILVLFMTFQFSTSLVCLIEKCNDTTIGIYDQDEDSENSKESKNYKELKSEFVENNNFDFTFLSNKNSSKVDDLYLISDYKAATKITILPPE